MNTKPPGSGFPFGGSVIENLEMMSKAWSAGLAQVPGFASPASIVQSIPSMMVPTLDVNELDKRIADLRAVEQWLALNANMLRASIQTLEVQRNTIATLQTLGATMMSAPMMAQPATAGPASAPKAAPAPAAAAASSSRFDEASAAGGGPSRRARRPAQTEAPQPSGAEMPLNPAAWWANLQDQFTRIAAAAAGDASGTKAAGKESAGKEGASRGDPGKGASKDDQRPSARKPPTRRAS